MSATLDEAINKANEAINKANATLNENREAVYAAYVIEVDAAYRAAAIEEAHNKAIDEARQAFKKARLARYESFQAIDKAEEAFDAIYKAKE